MGINCRANTKIPVLTGGSAMRSSILILLVVFSAIGVLSILWYKFYTNYIENSEKKKYD